MNNIDEKSEFAERIRALIAQGLNLEGLIEATGMEVREQAKIEYGSHLLDARLNIMSALAAILHGRSGQPGRTSESISSRLLLICLYVQGAGFTERMISEGQYVKAAAALKPDFDVGPASQAFRLSRFDRLASVFASKT